MSLINNVAGLQACKVIKKRLQGRCFLVNVAKFLRTPVLKNICKWMLLNSYSNKKLWCPNKNRRVCSLHVLDGQPTKYIPNPTLHMGYHPGKKEQVLFTFVIKKFNKRQHEHIFPIVPKRKSELKKFSQYLLVQGQQYKL